MSYVLVNSSSLQVAEQAACDIKAKLHLNFGRRSIIVRDFMSETERGQAMYAEITKKNVRGARALAIILEQRKALIKQVILPAVDKGIVVIYVGGVLDDTRYVKTLEFHEILKENQEMLQSIGGHTYPLGAVYAKCVMDSPNTSRGYNKRVDRMLQSMAGLKLIGYDPSYNTMNKINSLFG
jgi:hypothetical protein